MAYPITSFWFFFEEKTSKEGRQTFVQYSELETTYIIHEVLALFSLVADGLFQVTLESTVRVTIILLLYYLACLLYTSPSPRD